MPSLGDDEAYQEIDCEFEYMVQYCTVTTGLPCLVFVMTAWYDSECPFCGSQSHSVK